MGRFGTAGGVDGGGEGSIRDVSLEPVVGGLAGMRDEAGGERQMMAAANPRQQVGRRGAPDVLVAERDPIRLVDEDPVLDRLVETGAEVGVQGALAAPRPRRRAGWQAVRRQLEGGGGLRQLVPSHRPARRREQADHSPRFGAAPCQAGDHQVVERAGEARVGNFPAGSEELFGDEG